MKIIKNIPLKDLKLSEYQINIFHNDGKKLFLYEDGGLKGLMIIAKYSSSGKDYFLSYEFMSLDMQKHIKPYI